jgi:hypothetical protein
MARGDVFAPTPELARPASSQSLPHRGRNISTPGNARRYKTYLGSILARLGPEHFNAGNARKYKTNLGSIFTPQGPEHFNTGNPRRYKTYLGSILAPQGPEHFNTGNPRRYKTYLGSIFTLYPTGAGTFQHRQPPEIQNLPWINLYPTGAVTYQLRATPGDTKPHQLQP